MTDGPDNIRNEISKCVTLVFFQGIYLEKCNS